MIIILIAILGVVWLWTCLTLFGLDFKRARGVKARFKLLYTNKWIIDFFWSIVLIVFCSFFFLGVFGTQVGLGASFLLSMLHQLTHWFSHRGEPKFILITKGDKLKSPWYNPKYQTVECSYNKYDDALADWNKFGGQLYVL